MSRDLERYLALDYPIEILPSREEGGFVARNPDLPGCIAQASTVADAMDELEHVRRQWIQLRLEKALPIPEPVSDDYSGRILLRMPSSLHESLAQIAKRREVSLNLLVNTALAQYVGAQLVTSEVAAFSERILEAIRSLRTSTFTAARISLDANRQPFADVLSVTSTNTTDWLPVRDALEARIPRATGEATT